MSDLDAQGVTTSLVEPFSNIEGIELGSSRFSDLNNSGIDRQHNALQG